jgi:hypothetical protein
VSKNKAGNHISRMELSVSLALMLFRFLLVCMNRERAVRTRLYVARANATKWRKASSEYGDS